MASLYEHLRDQPERLIALLEARDRAQRLGLVWEREDPETADRSANDDVIALDLYPRLSAGGGESWGNLLIEGENRDVLRALRVIHQGRIRAIYIDPPYNTGL